MAGEGDLYGGGRRGGRAGRRPRDPLQQGHRRVGCLFLPSRQQRGSSLSVVRRFPVFYLCCTLSSFAVCCGLDKQTKQERFFLCFVFCVVICVFSSFFASVAFSFSNMVVVCFPLVVAVVMVCGL